jgi:hypothetical protein
LALTRGELCDLSIHFAQHHTVAALVLRAVFGQI